MRASAVPFASSSSSNRSHNGEGGDAGGDSTPPSLQPRNTPLNSTVPSRGGGRGRGRSRTRGHGARGGNGSSHQQKKPSSSSPSTPTSTSSSLPPQPLSPPSSQVIFTTNLFSPDGILKEELKDLLTEEWRGLEALEKLIEKYPTKDWSPILKGGSSPSDLPLLLEVIRSRKGTAQGIRKLLVLGADVNEEHSATGITPLILACYTWQSAIVTALLEAKDLDCFATTKAQGINALMALLKGIRPRCKAGVRDVSSHALTIAKELLQHCPALLEITDPKKRLPIHYAIASGRPELVTVLANFVDYPMSKKETIQSTLVTADGPGTSPLQAAEYFYLVATAHDHQEQNKVKQLSAAVAARGGGRGRGNNHNRTRGGGRGLRGRENGVRRNGGRHEVEEEEEGEEEQHSDDDEEGQEDEEEEANGIAYGDQEENHKKGGAFAPFTPIRETAECLPPREEEADFEMNAYVREQEAQYEKKGHALPFPQTDSVNGEKGSARCPLEPFRRWSKCCWDESCVELPMTSMGLDKIGCPSADGWQGWRRTGGGGGGGKRGEARLYVQEWEDDDRGTGNLPTTSATTAGSVASSPSRSVASGGGGRGNRGRRGGGGRRGGRGEKGGKRRGQQSSAQQDQRGDEEGGGGEEVAFLRGGGSQHHFCPPQGEERLDWDGERSWHVLLELTSAVGLNAALSGRGAVRQTSTRHHLIAYFGIDYVSRDAIQGKDVGSEEHQQNILQEIVAMRKAAYRQNRVNSKTMEDWRYAFQTPKKWSKEEAPYGGLSNASVVYLMNQVILNPSTKAINIAQWGMIIAEAVELIYYRSEGKVTNVGQVFPVLLEVDLWSRFFVWMGRAGRMLCYGLTGQLEGPGGEVLSAREEQMFDGLWEILLRLLVLNAHHIEFPEDKEEERQMKVKGKKRTIASIILRLGKKALDPLWVALEDSMQVMLGMVEEPARFATLVRGYLAWCLLTDEGAAATEPMLLKLLRGCVPIVDPQSNPLQLRTRSRYGTNPLQALRTITAGAGTPILNSDPTTKGSSASNSRIIATATRNSIANSSSSSSIAASSTHAESRNAANATATAASRTTTTTATSSTIADSRSTTNATQGIAGAIVEEEEEGQEEERRKDIEGKEKGEEEGVSQLAAAVEGGGERGDERRPMVVMPGMLDHKLPILAGAYEAERGGLPGLAVLKELMEKDVFLLSSKGGGGITAGIDLAKYMDWEDEEEEEEEDKALQQVEGEEGRKEGKGGEEDVVAPRSSSSAAAAAIASAASLYARPRLSLPNPRIDTSTPNILASTDVSTSSSSASASSQQYLLRIPPIFIAFVHRCREGLNRVILSLPSALQIPLSVLLRIPGVVDTRQKLEYLSNHMDQLQHRGSTGEFSLTMNRFMENKYEHLEMIIQQLAATSAKRLTGSLSIQLVSEPGIGDGPVREFLDEMKLLFSPTPLPAVANRGIGLAPSRLREKLPLFTPLQHHGDAEAIGPLPEHLLPRHRPSQAEGKTKEEEDPYHSSSPSSFPLLATHPLCSPPHSLSSSSSSSSSSDSKVEEEGGREEGAILSDCSEEGMIMALHALGRNAHSASRSSSSSSSASASEEEDEDEGEEEKEDSDEEEEEQRQQEVLRGRRAGQQELLRRREEEARKERGEDLDEGEEDQRLRRRREEREELLRRSEEEALRFRLALDSCHGTKESRVVAARTLLSMPTSAEGGGVGGAVGERDLENIRQAFDLPAENPSSPPFSLTTAAASAGGGGGEEKDMDAETSHRDLAPLKEEAREEMEKLRAILFSRKPPPADALVQTEEEMGGEKQQQEEEEEGAWQKEDAYVARVRAWESGREAARRSAAGTNAFSTAALAEAKQHREEEEEVDREEALYLARAQAWDRDWARRDCLVSSFASTSTASNKEGGGENKEDGGKGQDDGEGGEEKGEENVFLARARAAYCLSRRNNPDALASATPPAAATTTATAKNAPSSSASTTSSTDTTTAPSAPTSSSSTSVTTSSTTTTSATTAEGGKEGQGEGGGRRNLRVGHLFRSRDGSGENRGVLCAIQRVEESLKRLGEVAVEGRRQAVGEVCDLSAVPPFCPDPSSGTAAAADGGSNGGGAASSSLSSVAVSHGPFAIPYMMGYHSFLLPSTLDRLIGGHRDNGRCLTRGGGMDRLTLYQVAGRILGLSIRNAIPLGIYLPPPFWKVLLATTSSEKPLLMEEEEEEQEEGIDGKGTHSSGRKDGQDRRRKKQQAVWEEYVGADEVFKKSMREILAHDFSARRRESKQGEEGGAAAGVFDDLTFTITEKTPAGMKEVELIPDGSEIWVMNYNKTLYVELVCLRRLIKGADEEMMMIRKGLLEVIPDRFISIFSAQELCEVIAGPRKIDLSELRRYVQYERGFRANHPTVQAFWEIVLTDLTEEEKRKLLLFWSGSSTPPAMGFSQNAEDEWQWTISRLTGPGVSTSTSLPEASTCDRRLSLPEYNSAAQLKDRLMIAITYGCKGYDRV